MDNYNYTYDNRNSDEMMRRTMYFQMKAKQERKDIRKLGNIMGIALTAYIVFQFLSVSLLEALDLMDVYENSVLFQYGFTIIAVELVSLCLPFGIMALVNRKNYVTPVVPSKKIKTGSLLLWVGFGMLCCIGADYIVGILNVISKSTGFSLEHPEMLSPDSWFACVLSVLATAVIPPVCEEFAMRCCGVGLLRKYGKGFAVTAVAMIFGLVHGNIVQFIFASLIGLILGYVTVKTDSILPAIFIHAFNNGMSVVVDVINFVLGKDVDENATAVLFIFWLVFGAVSTVILFMKKEFRKDVQPPREPFSNSIGQKLTAFFVSPGMIVPFAFFLISIFSTISRK